MSVEVTDMVSVPHADWEALRAEVKRLRRDAGAQAALSRMQADPGADSDESAVTFTESELAAAWGLSE
ncbi:MAG: hypothetical protein QM621_00280 [Aeromicrobium sp.]|uniref:hypothetical protein n=1 Tax=Aeromicrobium sp. TaxID=1871063 RepID=UPI0039E4000A